MTRSKSSEEQKQITLINRLILTSFALLFGGLSLESWANNYWIVDQHNIILIAPNPILLKSLAASIGVGFLFFAYTIFYLRAQIKSESRGGLGCFIIFCFVLGAPSAIVFSQIALILNGLLDSSQTTTFQTSVISKRRNRGTGKNTRVSWDMDVRGWRNSSDTVRIELQKSEYDAIHIGTPVQVITKPGALGYEWIVSRSIKTP